MMKFNQMDYLMFIEDFPVLYNALYAIGEPVWTKQISTAAVSMNEKTRKITLLINPDFFFSLSFIDQSFILSHECLHVILGHIERTERFKLHSFLANLAQDIVINEGLVSDFRYNRLLMKMNGCELCFVNTVFNTKQIKDHKIKTGMSFEYYYNLLIYLKNEIPNIDTFDEHGDFKITEKDEDGNDVTYGPISEESLEKMLDDLKGKVSEKDFEDFKKKFSKAGQGNSETEIDVSVKAVKKIDWERLVRHRIASLMKDNDKDKETFLYRPRRITNLPDDIFLPDIREDEYQIKEKFNVVFFIDASPSCSHLIEKFFSIALSVPEKLFNVHCFSFATSTYPIDLKSRRIIRGYGTNFSILEERIQDDRKELFKNKYPDLVFVITDGAGTHVYPEKPEKWHFLLLEDGSRKYIPNGSKIINIE